MADIRTAAKRKIGASGMSCAPIGLGCMSLSGVYGKISDEDGVRFVQEAIDLGMDMLDSSDMYGWGHNEELLGKALKDGYRDKVVLATKFGQRQGEGGVNLVDGRPEYVQQACEVSLKRLGVDVIDLYYQHRIDRNVPIEDTVGAMAKLVEQGKVRAIALSEASPKTIRAAHAVHPLAAIQNEYSLMFRAEAEETLQTTRELGIGFVGYAPLGRGMLTGAVRSEADFVNGDSRGRHPRFQGENFDKNLAIVDRLTEIAAGKGCTIGQLVLAWVLAQGDDIIAIPGTKRMERLKENLGALDVSLSSDELQQIRDAVPAADVAGLRYPEGAMKAVYV